MNPRFTDDDAETARGGFTCPRSLGQHVEELSLDPNSVPFLSLSAEHPSPWKIHPTSRLPTLTPAVGLRGAAAEPGIWNLLPGLCSSSTSLAGLVLRLALGCGTDEPLPAFVTRRQCDYFPSSPLLFGRRPGRPLADYFKAAFGKAFRGTPFRVAFCLPEILLLGSE